MQGKKRGGGRGGGIPKVEGVPLPPGADFQKKN
jgi:hypothetical protein